MSRKMGSARGNGCEASRFAWATTSIRRRSKHVVDRNEFRGSEEPGGGGKGEVERGGSEVMDMVFV